ncbi:MAG TPA: cbb3-type cytochrome oxidase assembly protein CcoS [Steroidobacteraceae bacterium]|nr:cbb3-type cytochrome oxidase assembly protein CcoS [Steroidobacteraceae bacterium]
MGIIYVLIPISLVLLGFACWAFFWAVGNGQFEELDGPAWEILAEDEPAEGPGVGGGDRSARGDELRC